MTAYLTKMSAFTAYPTQFCVELRWHLDPGVAKPRLISALPALSHFGTSQLLNPTSCGQLEKTGQFSKSRWRKPKPDKFSEEHPIQFASHLRKSITDQSTISFTSQKNELTGNASIRVREPKIYLNWIIVSRDNASKGPERIKNFKSKVILQRNKRVISKTGKGNTESIPNLK